MTTKRPQSERHHDYVTIGGVFNLSGVAEAHDNQMLKIATFDGGHSTVTTDAEPQSASHSFAILSDEGQSLGSGGLAPLPLQYVLAGIAF